MGGQSTACDIDFTKNNLCSTYKTKLFKTSNLNDILIWFVVHSSFNKIDI